MSISHNNIPVLQSWTYAHADAYVSAIQGPLDPSNRVRITQVKIVSVMKWAVYDNNREDWQDTLEKVRYLAYIYGVETC